MENSFQRIWDSIVLSSEERELYKFDEDAHDKLLEKKPWSTDIHYFKRVRISAVAMIKMVMHAISGKNLEIMGLMQGKVIGDEIIVLDAFGLPVEGTETRVNASSGANEYMVQYVTSGEVVGKKEGTCGWYHSHPGYGCWLSGIDVDTQKIHQRVEDPYLAIVIDPIRTISSGKVEIGCFRTYPEDKIPEENLHSNYQHIPLNKIEDFGVHYKCYYTLEHSFFKSSMDTYILDCLWNKYWTQTLSSSPILKNKEYSSSLVFDLSQKIEKIDKNPIRMINPTAFSKEEKTISKISNDASKVGIDQAQGITNLLLKNLLFYR
jgi:COP9 signalosome complex subunit 5